MKSQLTGAHQATYDSLFHHPVAHNLEWRAVRSLLVAVADEVEENLATLKVTRNGQAVMLHPPRGKDFDDIEEVMKVRRFLERSGTKTQQPAAGGAHLLVVIDHRQARVYRAELSGSLPERIMPYDPHDYGRHLHYVQDDSNGQRKPEQKSFYEAIARTLQGAEKILVFGSGTGASSAMEQLLADLKRHHAELAKRIVGSVVLDQQHLTEDQLLARAREFYAKDAS
jgi:hypothetical protein